MVRNKHETIINPEDKKPGNFEGKQKFKWKSYKTGDKIPREVMESLIEQLKDHLVYFNIKFCRYSPKFLVYLPLENLVIDWLKEETPKEMALRQEKREICKKLGLKRIVISKYKYQNIL